MVTVGGVDYSAPPHTGKAKTYLSRDIPSLRKVEHPLSSEARVILNNGRRGAYRGHANDFAANDTPLAHSFIGSGFGRLTVSSEDASRTVLSQILGQFSGCRLSTAGTRPATGDRGRLGSCYAVRANAAFCVILGFPLCSR